MKAPAPSKAVRAGAGQERPVFFQAGAESLFGILTRPTTEALSTAVVLVPGGAGTRDSINRNRMWVRLARHVAELGFHALRFDFHGAGESSGIEQRLRLDRPFTEDLSGAVRWAADQGVANFVLVGSCYGARTALSYAPEVRGLTGVVLATPYVRDMAQGERVATLMAVEMPSWQYMRRAFSRRTLRGVLDREKRRAYIRVAKAKGRRALQRLRPGTRSDGVSSAFLGPLTTMVERRIPLLFLFGEEDNAYQDFLRARSGRLGRLLESSGSTVEVMVLPGKVHAFPTVRGQEAVVERITDWLLRRAVAGA